MALDLYLAYLAACLLIATIPGPTFTVIVANSLRHGARAGLLNVAGTQLGLALIMAVLVIGLSSVIAAMGFVFEWLRYAGAAYLAWLGWKLLRQPDALDTTVSSCCLAPRPCWSRWFPMAPTPSLPAGPGRGFRASGCAGFHG